MTNDAKIIGSRIAMLRKFTLHLSQKELAEKLECTQKSIHSWESGKTLIPLNVLLCLCRFSGVDLDHFDPDKVGPENFFDKKG